MMIGKLPKSINIDGVDYPIRTDYRDCLLIMTAFNDVELTEQEKCLVLLQILYFDEIPEVLAQEAVNQGILFLDCNRISDNHINQPKLYDWEQDEQMIFSAINKVAHREVRNDDYLHWWTFLGYFNEIGQGTFSSVVAIRDKKARHKKLDKSEQEFYKQNKSLVDLKTPISEREQKIKDREMQILDEFLQIKV